MRSLPWLVFVSSGCTGGPDSPSPIPPPPSDGPIEAGWYGLSPLPEAVQEVSVVTVDDEVWVLGGFDAGLQVSDRIWILGGLEDDDPTTATWRPGPTLPRPMHHHNTAVVGGQIYVLGGLEGSFVPFADSWVLDPAAGSWTELPPVPEAMGSAAVGVVDGEILLAGGLTPNTDTLGYAFDPVAETWRPLPDLPAGRDHAVGAGGDAMRVLGGRDDGLLEVRSDVWVLDGDRWVSAAPMPTARAGTAGTALPDGTVVVAGGEGNPADPDGIFDEVERYDPTTDTWAVLDDMPTPRHGTGAAPFAGGLLVPGGATVQAFRAVDTVEWLALPPG
jgi:hypothetical protein